MSYNVPQGLLDMLQSGALPSSIKVVSNDPAGGAGAGNPADGSWANPYRTIGAAVDAMTAPDPDDPSTWFEQLWIMAGTYNEDVTITRSKYIAIYTIGAVRIGIPDNPGPGEPKSLIWDKEVSTFPGFIITMPMPMAEIADFTLLEITGDIIIKGSTDTRSLILQNTKAEILQGENPEDPGAWGGTLNLQAYRSKLTSVQFGDKVNYGWLFRECSINSGVFVGGHELAGGSIYFDQTEVGEGTFTPNGHSLQTASLWAPETDDAGAFKQSQFEGAVTARYSTAQDCTFEAFTSTNDAGKMRRCEFNGNVDVADITLIEDCIFGANFENDTGDLDVKGCFFNGGVDFGSVGMVSNCRFNDTLDATSAEAYFLGCRMAGVVTFTDPTKFYVDIATNSMTHLAGSEFPAGTNLLNNTTIP